MEARATYEAGVARAEAADAAEDGRIRTLSFLRLFVAVGAIALVVGIVWGGLALGDLGLVALCALTFLGLVIVHARAFAAKERANATLAFHKRGLARLGTEWRAFPSHGSGRTPAAHPYADDLDIFGPSSLFQLIDATETPFGQDVLAGWLAGPTTPEGASWADDLRERQAAVRDVAARVEWRERLAVEGALLHADSPDPAPFLAWAEGKVPLEVPGFVVLLARVLPLLVVAAFVAGRFDLCPRSTWAAVVALELALGTPFRARASKIADTVAGQLGGFARYGALFAAAARLGDQGGSTRIRALWSRLAGKGGNVAREMGTLERIVGFVEARNNEVFKIFIGPVLMWDLNLAILLERWRVRAGGHVRGWFATLGELEAFASLGGFAFDRPGHAWPELEDAAVLRARELGHPLIDAKRVGNDVTLPREGTALVVTGSNMSGKSTLLRALGVNVVLANAGAPVSATSFSVGKVTLATSMRIKDSLDEGVSHFYAEIKKLKQVVDLGRSAPPVLFLLDEILHGTNSRERIIGARAVIRDLVSHGALGAVSTHDLGIASLADAEKDRIRNVHFEEQIADDGTMTFDYHLREGLVQSSNALRLMRAIGLDVPLDTGRALSDGPPLTPEAAS